MKRKLFLLIGSFLLLLLAFSTYSLFNPSVVGPGVGSTAVPRKIITGNHQGIGKATGITVYDRDVEGKLRGMYEVKSWTQEEDGSYFLQTPSAMMLLKDGTRVYMMAETGRVWAEEVSGGMNVRQGKLSGKVQVWIDQSKSADRVHPLQRTHQQVLDQCIRIHMTDVRFNRDMLEIATDGDISLWSKTVDMRGRGLIIQWNEEPRELRRLEIVHGDVMIVKNLPEQMDMIQLPTETEDPASPTVTVVAAEPKKATPGTPETPAIVPPKAEGTETVALTHAPADKTKVKKTPEARNVYTAVLSKNVRVFAGKRQLRGADVLNLTFEWDQAWRDNEDKDKAEPDPSKSTKEPVAKGETPDTGEQMELYWEGPLVLTSVGYRPDADRKRYKITGAGDKVELSSEEARIVCKTFSFENPQQEAVFAGTDAHPARLVLARGDEVVTEGEIRFNRERGRGYLTDAGTITRFSDGPSAEDVESLAPELLLARSVTEHISWSKQVEIVVADREVVSKSGKKSKRPFIERARIRGDVKMRQRREGRTTDDYIKCDALDIDFTQAGGQVIPSKACAQGNIKGLQSGSEFSAKLATVMFRPAPKSKASEGEKKAEKKGEKPKKSLSFESGRAEAYRLIASGDVRVKHLEENNPKPLYVEADKIDAKLNYREKPGDKPRQLAVLKGTPARIWQGENRIEGETIEFDDVAGAARVIGPGTLRFVSQQDFSGNKVKTQRKTTIAWKTQMLYHGEGLYGVFDGDVDLLSTNDKGEDSLKCRQLRLFFSKEKKSAKGAKDPSKKKAKGLAKKNAKDASKKKAPRLGMGVDRFSSRKLSTVEAEGGYGDAKLAVMRNRVQHPTNPKWVLRHLELRGNKVLHSVATGDTNIIGEGTFLAQDYREPEKKGAKKPRKKGDGGLASGGKLERPSQSLFSWKKSLKLSQKKAFVSLREDVTMVHRSGNKLMNVKGLIRPPMGELKTGRVVHLRGDAVDTWFVKSDKESMAMNTDGGPNVGALRLFQAIGDVTLKDGSMRADGQKVLYDALSKQVTVWGYRNDKATKTNARMIYQDADTNRLQALEAPKLEFNLKTGTGKIVSLEATGG